MWVCDDLQGALGQRGEAGVGGGDERGFGEDRGRGVHSVVRAHPAAAHQLGHLAEDFADLDRRGVARVE